jgi:hypothetical protein
MLFLACATVAFLLPFLLFNEHASETYLYLPVAFYCPMLAALLYYSIRSSPAYIASLAVIAALFAAATYNRNRHVDSGAAVAQRIIENLQVARWTEGTWQIRLAEAEPPLPRYGIYQYQGLATIDVGDPTLPGATCALQLATHNPNLVAQVVLPFEMHAPCPRAGTCFWVHADGSLSQVGGAE